MPTFGIMTAVRSRSQLNSGKSKKFIRDERSRLIARRPQGGAAVCKTVATAAGFDPLARNERHGA